ncbi:MAG: PorT family protein [Prevotella sp.]|nr:PorT family protein [Prevotella sp.]
MKKLFLSTLILLATVASHAQQAVGTVTLQPKVGINIASLTNTDGSDPRIGPAAGAELEYQVSDIVSLSGGVLYSMQGVKEKDNGVSATVKLDYINIPILANVYVTKGLAVKLGIQPGFMVNDKFKVASGSASGEVSFEDAMKAAGTDASLKKFDFSIPVGLSYEYKNVVLDARYNWGLTKVIDGVDTKNSVFQITLGYKFAL